MKVTLEASHARMTEKEKKTKKKEKEGERERKKDRHTQKNWENEWWRAIYPKAKNFKC